MSRLLEALAPNCKLINHGVYLVLKDQYEELKNLSYDNLKKRLSKINCAERKAHIVPPRPTGDFVYQTPTPMSNSNQSSATPTYSQINVADYCKFAFTSLEKYKNSMTQTDYCLLKICTQAAA